MTGSKESRTERHTEVAGAADCRSRAIGGWALNSPRLCGPFNLSQNAVLLRVSSRR